MSIITNFW